MRVTIDKPIDVDGWDPYQTMRLRILYGFTWTPSILQQPISIAPGLSGPTGTVYDPLHPPAGSIKVSVDPTDYPAFDPPTPPPPPSNTPSPVGAFLYTVNEIGDMYANQPWDKTRDGEEVENDPRGPFVKHLKMGPFGPWGYFTPKK